MSTSESATWELGSAEELAAAVRGSRRVAFTGGASKTPRTAHGEVAVLSTRGLAGLLEYRPEEFTVTARSGTQVAELARALAEHRQYLPFDPLLGERGATVGGTIAAAANGPGRLRYGGVRDFLLGVRFVDGAGRQVRGGAKVVKNAAGFDLPKLLVGSLGRLGVIVEATFKVFPLPPAYRTLRLEFSELDDALAAQAVLLGSALDLAALDLEVRAERDGAVLWLRLGGSLAGLGERVRRIPARLREAGPEPAALGELEGEEDSSIWRRVVNLEGLVPPHGGVVKVPLTPGCIASFESERRAAGLGGACRHVAGGQMAWLSVENGQEALLQGLLLRQGLRGVTLAGGLGRRFWGAVPQNPLAVRVLRALDPEQRLAPACEC